jgi:spermidine synthase
MRLKFGKRRSDDDGIEVVEERGVRTLRLGSRATQSAMRVARPWELELIYTRAMMACLLFNEAPQSVLMVGLGGGSLAKFIRKHLPATDITAVEIDPRIIAVARGQFELPPDDDTLHVVEGDGALFVRQHSGEYDVILLDGFDAGNQVEALATESFYSACRRALKPGGVLVVNLWGRDPSFAEYFGRLTEAFDDQVGWLSVSQKTNVVVFGFEAADAPEKLATQQAHAAVLAKRFGLYLQDYARDFQWAQDIAPLLP